MQDKATISNISKPLKLKVFLIGGFKMQKHEFITVKNMLEKEGYTVITPFFIKGAYTYDIELNKRHLLCDVCNYVYPLQGWHLHADAQHDFNYAMFKEKIFLSRDAELRRHN